MHFFSAHERSIKTAKPNNNTNRGQRTTASVAAVAAEIERGEKNTPMPDNTHFFTALVLNTNDSTG